MECGLCRSGRARRTAGAEVRCWPGGKESRMTGAGRGGKTVPARLPGTHKLLCKARSVVVENLASYDLSSK